MIELNRLLWGADQVPDGLTTIVALILSFHVLGLMLLLRNQRWMSWPAAQRTLSDGNLRVAVIVPARDEAGDIEACIQSLLCQTYSSLTVVAVNDHSTDGTGEILRKLVDGDQTLKLVENPPQRDGWLGKHNALQSGIDSVPDADLYLLTDADVIFKPETIAAAVAELEHRELDMLSLYPCFEFVTFCEHLLLPIYVAGTALLLGPEVESDKSPHAMAVGAFILVRGDRLRSVGGMEPICGEILDDVGLAKLFRSRGWKIGVRSAHDLMQVRLFKNNRHAFFGPTKHMLGFVQKAVWLAPIMGVLPFLMYGALLYSVFRGIVDHDAVLLVLSALTLVIHYAALLLTRPCNRFHPIIALAFPCVSFVFAASLLRAAWLLGVRGIFEWRGRRTELS